MRAVPSVVLQVRDEAVLVLPLQKDHVVASLTLAGIGEDGYMVRFAPVPWPPPPPWQSVPIVGGAWLSSVLVDGQEEPRAAFRAHT